MAVIADLSWIDAQRDRMISLVTEWSEINSGTFNANGLMRMREGARAAFASLDPIVEDVPANISTEIDLTGVIAERSLTPSLSFRKKNASPGARRVLLSIHLDTVYSADHSFQHVRHAEGNRLVGPGVADAKGGLCVILVALQALQRSAVADEIDWEVLLNCDEEIGSPGSAEALVNAAKRNELGLVFEPAHADASLVGERKGSGNFTALLRGRAAHAGRDFHHGRNAIHAAAELVTLLDGMNRSVPGITVNVGRIDGGGPANVVSDLAIVRFNVRVPAHHSLIQTEGELNRHVESVARRDGISVQLTGGFTSPPRPMDVKSTQLYQSLADCGKELNLPITWHASGGVSDTNKLAAAGLPVIDTLGPSGGNLHSADEFMLIDTLVPKAKLTAMFLIRFASGEIQIPTGRG